MNSVYLQIWEESDIDSGYIPDGCSLHLSNEDRDSYIESIYSNRSSDIPSVYDRVIGKSIEVYIPDKLFDIVYRDRSIRIMEHEMNNLLTLSEIIPVND